MGKHKSLEKILELRKSSRHFIKRNINKKQLNYLLKWCKKVPSAGGFYPIKICVMQNKLEELANACVNQMFIAEAPIVLVLHAEPNEMLEKYGNRGWRYIQMEAGAIAQNIHLLCCELQLITIEIGAFDDDLITKITECPNPLLIIPISYNPKE